jgi:hypothetical protein
MTKLTKGKRLELTPSPRRTIRVHSGRVWLSEPACVQDVSLGSGESFRLSGAGVAILEALTDATLSVEP